VAPAARPIDKMDPGCGITDIRTQGELHLHAELI
jgi:hypothetical protein